MSLPQPSQLIKCDDISSCFQTIYNFLFAIFIGLAFLNFLYGALQYLLSGAKVFGKEEGKNRMKNSIIALIVVLVIPIILNLINPNIFKAKLWIPKITVTLPQLFISAPETSPEDVLRPGERVYDASPNPYLAEKLRNAQYITKIVVDCSKQKAKIYAKMQDGREKEVDIVNIRTGQPVGGANCNPYNVKGSHTTPEGTFILSNKRYNKNGIFSKETGANMGTRAITYDSSRGLLIHGSGTQEKDARFPNTYGCIRMKNADLAAIYDKVKEGETQLIIKNHAW